VREALVTDAGFPRLADRMRGAWQEYEQHESHVSKIVHQIDKLDPLQQALRYARQYPDLKPNPQYPTLRLGDFRAKEILDQITDPYLVGIRDGILRDWDAYESRKRVWSCSRNVASVWPTNSSNKASN
jgi:hypothetical protein